MKKLARVCVILPRLPPVVDGLGDYTLHIWRHYHYAANQNLSLLDQSTNWYFLTARDADSSAAVFPNASISPLPRESSQLSSVLEESGAEVVLLQFSGYGFDQNALPYHLADGLKQWLSKAQSRRLVTMFHELYAFGPPWKKAFWLSLPQQFLARSLCELSQVAVTSNHAYFNKLKDWFPHKDIRIIPIGANFENPKNIAKDWSCVSIFGKQRLDSVEMHRELLRFLTRQRLVRTIVLSGEPPASDLAKKERKALSEITNQATIKEVYGFPTDAVPDEVARCGLSITNVTSERLAKSGRFHLACALGQVTISMRSKRISNCAPLVHGVSFIEYSATEISRVADLLKDVAMLESIGHQARALSETEFSWSHNNAKWREIIG